jgi:hypothetical protein
MFEIDSELNLILENKRVALIGPSNHLIGSGLGKIIDSYDVVCRINESYAYGYEKDYGERTDIVFHNMNSLDGIPQIEEEFKEKWEEIKKIKYYVCPQYKIDDLNINLIEAFRKINFLNIPFYYIGDRNYDLLRSRSSLKPSTGLISSEMLLEYNIRELFISGLSFYYGKNLIAEGVHPAHYVGKLPQGGPTNGHNFLKEMEYFSLLMIKNCNRTRIDSFLYKILRLNGFFVRSDVCMIKDI